MPVKPGFKSSAKGLSKIRVLYRDREMSLWGIPYEMREGQAPKDITNRYRSNWIWLGMPGWWGFLSKPAQKAIKAFLTGFKSHVPGNPHEWDTLPKRKKK